MRKSRAAGIIIGMTMAFTAVAPVMPVGTYVSAASMTEVSVSKANDIVGYLENNKIYKLEDNIVLSKNETTYLDSNDTVVIDLNGNSLTYDAKDVAINNKGTLTIIDSSSGSGSITNTGAGGCIYNDSGATLTISGGSISGNNTNGNGGGINNYGTLNITGGSISGNTSKNGGGIYNIGTLTITGGSITGNTSTNGGGGIYNAKKSTISISGKVDITGNKNNSSDSDIDIANIKKINVIGDLTGSHIGVKMASQGAFTAGYSTYNLSLLPVNVFFSNDGYAVALKDSEAVFTDKKYKVQYQWKKNSDNDYNCTVTVDDGSGNNAYTKEYTGLAGSLNEVYENDDSLILSSSVPTASSGLEADIRNGKLTMKVTYVATDGYITGIGFVANNQDFKKDGFKAYSATYSVRVDVENGVTVQPYYIDNNDIRREGESTSIGQ